MKHLFVKILGIITIVLLICTLICGLWIAKNPTSDVAFHAKLSLVSVVVAIISQIVNLNKCKFCKNHK